MKEKNAKITFYKAGNRTTNKVTIPAEFARFLELSKENNDIKIILDEEKQANNYKKELKKALYNYLSYIRQTHISLDKRCSIINIL